jgi:hypothetical protein
VWAREAAKWGADFMARAVSDGKILLHIGDIQKDHGYLGRAESYPQMDRKILFCDSGASNDSPPGVACLHSANSADARLRRMLRKLLW